MEEAFDTVGRDGKGQVSFHLVCHQQVSLEVGLELGLSIRERFFTCKRMPLTMRRQW